MSTKSERKRASNQAFSISISNRRSKEQSILCLHNLTSWCWPPRNKCLVLTFKHVLNTFPCSIQFSVCIDDSHLSLIYAHYKPSHFYCKISQNTFYLYKIHQNRKKTNNIIHVYCQQKLVRIYCLCLMIQLCSSFRLGPFASLVSDHLYRFCKFLNWLFLPCLGSGTKWKPRKTSFWRIEHTKATVACNSLFGLKIKCYQIRAALKYMDKNLFAECEKS